ncbi:MAG: biotin--[acetyl-CoA-carboxylase] ligase [Planctomycetia bacterium]|nr:biotin--[acetyl-CoA-carboxylase] ligase [Planctomycetia bacterium]
MRNDEWQANAGARIRLHSSFIIGSAMDINRLARDGCLSRVEHHASLTSTNDRARALAAELRAGEIALVTADEQTAGRGRGANRWWTGPGSLACSLAFDPAAHGIRRAHYPLISLATAVAIVESLEPLAPGHPIGLHWPNDVFAGNRKLSGILVEALADGKHVVGVGLNVNNRSAGAPEELRDKTTSIAELTGREHDRTDVLLGVLARLWPNLASLASDAALLARHADRLCLQRGTLVVIASGGRRTEGLCAGIADDGALVLATEVGHQRFYSGVLVHA